MNEERRRSRPVLLVGMILFLSVGIVSAQDSEIADLKRRVAELEEKSENPLVGIDSKGRPFLKSEDGNFTARFGTRLQLRYTFQGRDENRGTGNTSDRSWGELERARFKMHGNFFNENLKYKIEFDGESDAGGANLTDAYFEYESKQDATAHTWSIGAGQWKPFFGRQEKMSSGKQLLVDRSLAMEYFSIDRNIGLFLTGRKEFGGDDGQALNYEFAVTNGFDSVNRNIGNGETDQVPAFVAHVDLDIMGMMGKDALSSGDLKRIPEPRLTAGASFASDQNNGSAGNTNLEYKIYQFAVDTVFKCSGFSLNAEYFGRFLDIPDDGTDSAYSHGAYIESGYMLTDSLQVVGRGSAVWDPEGPSNSAAVEAGGGLNYFFKSHNLKLSGDIVYLDIPPVMILATEKFPGSATAVGGISSSSANLDVMQGVMVRFQAQLDF